MQSRRPTLHDVARVAEVSHQTVSRVLNDAPYVSKQARDRVLAAVREVGYRRNDAARALVTRRTGMIGMLLPTSSGVGVTRKAGAIEAAAHAAGYGMLVGSADPDDTSALAAAADGLARRGVDGLVVVIAHRQAIALAEELSQRVPSVLLASEVLEDPSALAAPEAGRAEESGPRLAVEHLVGLGHRRIAHIAGPRGWISAETRVHAYREVMAEHGLPDRVVSATDWTARAGHAATLELLHADPPTAVFAANDQFALGVLHACHERDIRVPHGLSVVGYDDSPDAAYFWPPLTTVAKRAEELGRRAVALLLARLAEPEAHGSAEPVTPRLVMRASTAPPGVHGAPSLR